MAFTTGKPSAETTTPTGTSNLPPKPLTPDQAAECTRLRLAVLAYKQARLEAQRAWYKDPRNPNAGIKAYDPDSPLLNEVYTRYIDLKSTTTSPQQHKANGSTGPRTPEGKLKSAQNAFRHGFACSRVILDASEVEAYDRHLDSYAFLFCPVNQPEADAVRRIADAQWRMDLLKTAESTLVELEEEYQCLMLLDHDKLGVRDSPWELRHYRTLCFIDATHERAWDLLHRYYADAAREYARAFLIFEKLKEMREGPEPEPEPERPDEEVPQAQPVRNELPAAKPARNTSRMNKSRRLNLGRLVR